MTDPTPHILTLAGSNRSQYTTQDFSITQEFGRQGASATINLWDQHLAVGTLNVIPKALDTVLLQGSNGTSTVSLFGGLVANPSLQWQGPNDNEWGLTCRDYTYYADMAIVEGTFIGQPADVIIKLLMTQANCGLTYNHVIPGPIIHKLQIKYLPLSVALKKISMLASGAALDASGAMGAAIKMTGKSIAEYAWYVDENRDVHWFNAMSASDSGIVFTDTGFTDSGGSTRLANYDRESLKYEWDGSNLRTACIVRGGKFSGGYTDQFVANGQQRAWPLTFDLDPNVTSTLILTVGISAKSVSVISAANVAGSTIITEYAVVQQSNGQWFLTVGTDVTPPIGSYIILTYAYGGTIVARADDFVAEAQYGGPNHGVFAAAINDSTLLSFATAHQRAQRELAQYSSTAERVSFKTTEDWPGHIRAGQTFIFSSSVTPDAHNNYSLGLRARFLAERVTITCSPGQYRVYTIVGTRIS